MFHIVMYQLRPFFRKLLFVLKRGIKSLLPFERIQNKLRGGFPEFDDDSSVILLHYGGHESAPPSQSRSSLVVRLRSPDSANSLNTCCNYPSHFSRALQVGVEVTIAVQESMRRQCPIGCGACRFQEHRIPGERHCQRWPFGASFLNPM